ncbi:vacuolar protein sorting-associated protein 18 homolog isoform X2 [Planococcus citri]|uniref:vacuolar protein sorting-associated protein 18 homolog isoform X2 n=1 Tax=Planococcus citri TaxID=170843 RepID=UPI0031F82EC4
MTSILEQYEQATSPYSHTAAEPGGENSVGDYDYLDASYDQQPEESSWFSVKPLNVTLAAGCKLQSIAVGKDTVVYSTSNNTLFLSDRSKASKAADEIDASKAVGAACKVKNIFLDPTTGRHLLFSVLIPCKNAATSSAINHSHELFYLNTTSGNHHYKPKLMAKLKGHEITAVGWNRIHVTDYSSSFILLGTSKGLIFETEINSETEKLFQSGIESHCRQVFDIGKGNASMTITGIEFNQFENAPENFFILVTTNDRLYQFVGKTNGNEEKPFLSQIFNNYLNMPENCVKIGNAGQSSVLHVYYESNSNENDQQRAPASASAHRSRRVVPKFFAWQISGVGILFGELNLHWDEGLSQVCVQKHRIDYDSSQLPESTSVALTEFHVLLLYPNRIIAVSNINKRVIFVRNNDETHGKYVAITRDYESNVWIVCEKNICKGKFVHEDRSVWKIYADLNEFSLAKKYCKGNPNSLRVVKKKEAEYCFGGGLYEESASLYAELDCISFEEIALKFLLAEQINALKLYLYRTLDKLKSHESAHISVIVFWLFEINEKQLALLKNDDSKTDEYRRLQSDMKAFLSYPSVANCLTKNKEMVYKVLNSHGDVDNLITLATGNKDYENMIRYYLEDGQIHSALSLFRDEPVAVIRKHLTKSFLTEFTILAPKETVDLLIKLGRNMEPSSFLSSLIIPNDNLNQALEVIRYLEYCVHSLHSRDESVHNYLITLYAKHKPDKLMQYLDTQGQDSSMVNYDIRYALKLCQEYGLKKACVQLSSLLGLWESAVDLALTVNLELAKRTAIQPSNQNPELCKRLWLKIAQHVVNECNDIEKAMEFLQQCDLIKIEDVLPFFSDFVTIDLFKDAICSTLQEYNEHIEHLKEEIDDAINSADNIRSNINSFRHKYTIIHSSDLCSSCNIQLLLRPFYVFPCSHHFHKDCLLAEMKPYLDESDSNELQRLQHWSAENRYTTAVNADSSPLRAKENLESKLDALLANECFFCGDLVISNIDKPFVNDDEFEKIYSDWQ